MLFHRIFTLRIGPKQCFESDPGLSRPCHPRLNILDKGGSIAMNRIAICKDVGWIVPIAELPQ